MLVMAVEKIPVQGGDRAGIVAIGAAMLGFAAGAAGTFLFLRKRALVSDAIAHATLPGVAIAAALVFVRLTKGDLPSLNLPYTR